MFQIGLKTFFCLKKLKTLWTYVISDRKGEEIVGTFPKKNYIKQIKKRLTVGLIKKTYYK